MALPVKTSGTVDAQTSAVDTATLKRLLAGMSDLRDGNFRRRLVVSGGGMAAELASVFNELADRNQQLVGELERVRGAAEQGQWPIRPIRLDDAGDGGWARAADSVNGLTDSLLGPVAEFSRVLGALAEGDLTQRMQDESISGHLGELSRTVNRLLDQLTLYVSEMGRVAGEVGKAGRLGVQAEVPGLSGTWRDLVNTVNRMVADITGQVRDISQVAKSVAAGDLSSKITVEVSGEMRELKDTLNSMVDQLSAFADEVTRVAREVGTDGRLGGQAQVHGVAGTWKDLTDSVNFMADNLTSQVRSIAQVATAVARGDLSQKIDVDARGEMLQLKNTLNTMVDQLSAFADEVTRVAREVGTDGKLGGQARVHGVAGTWKDLTDNVNIMARNLTSQVRNIAQVTTAVASGDLSKKIDVDARGEILELKTTINTMVDRLSAFASEVTRVAREVGTEGKLGGQAEVIGVSGTWQRLTESVNHLAGNLTTQVRAIANVATAVTNGDLSQRITVDASGEVAELKDNINAMISNLKETTRTNEEQDWLKTNLARISALMQGQQDLTELASRIMSELTPLVSAQYGAFFLARTGADNEVTLERAACYGATPGSGPPPRFASGESLVGQVAKDKKSILMTGAPANYIQVSSGLGASAPVNVIVLPILFEGQVLGVIELGSVNEFTSVHLDLLEQLKETIGVDVNTILSNSRTEALLAESQHLAQELQTRSEELEQQQNELQHSNTELAEKAALLASRNRDIEIKNAEIEQARQELEQRAQQLSLASTYKSEFLANMSHELRTPLNSALILAKLLGDNLDGNLTPQQVDLANTIHAAGADLLQLINDVLDLAKVEAGHMKLLPEDVELAELTHHVDSLYRPMAEEKGLEFEVTLENSVPPVLRTDRNRLEQILRNLVSNAVKFTDRGRVQLHIRQAAEDEVHAPALPDAAQWLAFVVRDTGIGISAEKLPLIFDAFQQADGTTVRKYGGTGLGLSISRELTTLLGGELTVDSEPGRGTVFTLYLPVEQSTMAAGEPSEPAAVSEADSTTRGEIGEAAGDGDSGARMLEPPSADPGAAVELSPRARPPGPERGEPSHTDKVLIVDDDPRSVFALTTLLEQHGLEVVCADNGVAGLRVLQEQPGIKVVLMDVMMPELDGNDTIMTIRRMPRFRGLPIIAVTAKAMKGDRERSLASGANDCVTKPVDVEVLMRLLGEYLGPEPSVVDAN
jgi:signal transduction histidine kinase/HAMP domain-containing protein/CheY-like chemotaxis protein